MSSTERFISTVDPVETGDGQQRCEPAAEDLASENVLGYIHSIETAGMADGPGIRYVLFLSGCMLRCLYCHNPDTWHMHDGEPRSAGDVLADIGRYGRFLKRNGGVTLSGGEPLCQMEFARAILNGCKKLGLHTALDTNGYLGANVSDEFLADTDLVLLDIKEWDREAYRNLTGVALEPTLAFARRLADMGRPVWLRYVLVPGLTDNPDHIGGLADFVADLGNVERVDVLPFHKMGEYKWRNRGLPYTLSDTPTPGPAMMEVVRKLFRSRGLNVPVGASS